MLPNPPATKKEVVYLDTETTEINERAEVIELAIISASGNVLLDTRVQCQDDIPLEVQDIHGISKSDLEDSPTWPDIHQQVMDILVNAKAIKIYNSDFDMRLIKQTASRYDLTVPSDDFPPVICVMKRFANVFCDGLWQKLVNACQYQSIDVETGRAHSAKYDTELTIALDRSIDVHFEQQKEEIAAAKKRREANKKRRDKKMALVPDNASEYPYFATARPEGAVTLSQLKMKELDKYEYLGSCCNTYGRKGHLFKLKV